MVLEGVQYPWTPPHKYDTAPYKITTEITNYDKIVPTCVYFINTDKCIVEVFVDNYLSMKYASITLVDVGWSFLYYIRTFKSK